MCSGTSQAGASRRIQWSPLDYVDASIRTRHLRAAGADAVLWLTRSCSWIEQLPALGIKSFDPAESDPTTARTPGSSSSGPVPGCGSPRPRCVTCSGWVTDELVWAFRDHKKAGWATVTDWQQHTKQQTDLIEGLRKKVAAAERCRDDFRAIINDQRLHFQPSASRITAARNNHSLISGTKCRKCHE